MTRVIGLCLAVLACIMSNVAIQMMDSGNVPASIYAVLMTVTLGGAAAICLKIKIGKEEENE